MVTNIYDGKPYDENTKLKNIIRIECILRDCSMANFFTLHGIKPSAQTAYLKNAGETLLREFADSLNLNPEILLNAPR